MGQFKGGKDEAVKMLNLLGPSKAKELIDQIRLKDPNLALELESSLVTIEDLQFLTETMKVSLLRDVNLESFGLALRTVDKAIVEKILSHLSSGIITDIEDGLKGKPRPLSEVQEAQKKILTVVHDKILKGEILLNDDEQYV